VTARVPLYLETGGGGKGGEGAEKEQRRGWRGAGKKGSRAENFTEWKEERVWECGKQDLPKHKTKKDRGGKLKKNPLQGPKGVKKSEIT